MVSSANAPLCCALRPDLRLGKGALPPGGAVLRAIVFAILASVLLSTQAWDRSRMVAAAQPYGAQAMVGAEILSSLIVRSEKQPEQVRLAAFNDFFNQRIRFASDIETTGQVDEWASPLELLGRGAGDCEDYAIAKYFSLIAAGVPSARLRLVYVRADLDGGTIPHMVLAYYPQPTAEPLILDNLQPGVVAASLRRDLHPVFSFNAEGLWQGTGVQAAGDPVARLSRWRDVNAKARVQGFI
jgi:predicted transglutaminase-like cysteine proteinase